MSGVGPGGLPSQEAEKAKFQELVLCPRSDHGEGDPREIEEGDGLARDRLVAAVAEVKATTTSSRNRSKFCVPEEIRRMASDAAKSQDPVRRRHLRKIPQKARRDFEAEAWKPQCCGWRVAKFVLWKAKEKWRAKGWELPFGGQQDNEYVLRGMMWANINWLFSNNREIDVHGERHHRGVDGLGHVTQAGITVVDKHVQRRGKDHTSSWEVEPEHGSSLFVKSLKSWGTGIIGMGRGSMVPNAPCARAWEAGGVINSSTARRQFRRTAKCKRVHSHVYSTVLNGSSNWPWSGAMINKVRAWEAKILRLALTGLARGRTKLGWATK